MNWQNKNPEFKCKTFPEVTDVAEATVEAAVTEVMEPGLVGVLPPKTRIESVGAST